MLAQTDTHSHDVAPTASLLGAPGSVAVTSVAAHPRRAHATVMMLALGFLRAVLPAAMSGQAASAGTAATGQGLMYTFSIISHGLNADGAANDYQMIASARLSGDREWIQFFDPTDTQVDTGTYRSVQNKPMYYGDGAYYLAKRGVDTLTVVSVTHKKYFDLPGVVRASSMMGGLLTLQLTDPTITVSRIQPDTMVEDVQTHHWRIIDDHTMKTSVLGISTSQKVHSTTDFYFAAELAEDFNPFFQDLQALALSGSKAYGDQMQAALGQMDKGTPVLTVWRSTTTDSRGRGTSVLIHRITNVLPDDVPSKLFEIPAGYAKAGMDAVRAVKAGLPDSLTATTAAPPQKKSLLGNVLKVF